VLGTERGDAVEKIEPFLTKSTKVRGEGELERQEGDPRKFHCAKLQSSSLMKADSGKRKIHSERRAAAMREDKATLETTCFLSRG